jgi:diguanylate cyclase (GGDEF)-like protein
VCLSSLGPSTRSRIRAVLCETLPPPQERRRRILVVDDDSARRRLFATALGNEGYDVDTLPDGNGLVDYVRHDPPDLVLIDVMLPGASGFELCGELRMLEEMRLVPIALLTSALADEDSVVRGLLSGADDFIVTPTRLRELLARVRVQLRNRRDRELLQWARTRGDDLRSAARTDGLTGLSNRAAFDRALEASLRSSEPVVLALLDIDHFKNINDRFGHLQGDRVLVEVARALSEVAEPREMVARYGGEEIVVLARGSIVPDPMELGERVRTAVCGLRFPKDSGPDVVTGSVGVAWSHGPHHASAKALLAAADAALYCAKHEGRNRVRLARLDHGELRP